jgi:hypothetical protein
VLLADRVPCHQILRRSELPRTAAILNRPSSACPASRPAVATAKVYGAVQLIPTIAWLQATPTVPPGNIAGDSVTAGHTGGGAAHVAFRCVGLRTWRASRPVIVRLFYSAADGCESSGRAVRRRDAGRLKTPMTIDQS